MERARDGEGERESAREEERESARESVNTAQPVCGRAALVNNNLS